jgi:hypothetical protein
VLLLFLRVAARIGDRDVPPVVLKDQPQSDERSFLEVFFRYRPSADFFRARLPLSESSECVTRLRELSRPLEALTAAEIVASEHWDDVLPILGRVQSSADIDFVAKLTQGCSTAARTTRRSTGSPFASSSRTARFSRRDLRVVPQGDDADNPTLRPPRRPRRRKRHRPLQ